MPAASCIQPACSRDFSARTSAFTSDLIEFMRPIEQTGENIALDLGKIILMERSWDIK
jgi:hypothetical protein